MAKGHAGHLRSAGKIVCNYENHGDNLIAFDRVNLLICARSAPDRHPLYDPSASSSSDHDAAAAPKRIYLLEDHPTMRSGIKHLLEEDGACCIVGESAQAAEALESVPTLRPDLVIADLVLEGQSGLDFLKLSL